jgi:hypothetical protein
MKVHEIKDELEKMAKVTPELRKELDQAYISESGKKTRLKYLWKQYEARHKQLSDSKDYKDLQLH